MVHESAQIATISHLCPFQMAHHQDRYRRHHSRPCRPLHLLLTELAHDEDRWHMTVTPRTTPVQHT